MSEGKKDSTKNVSEFNRFLDNNQDFLSEKYRQYFAEGTRLGSLSSEGQLHTTLAFIYDIFSFGKYKNDPKLNATLQKSLADNIRAFVKQKLQASGSEEDPFHGPGAVQLLKYCIENNEMFAVHYDKKNSKQKPQEEEPVPLQSPENNDSSMQASGLSVKPSEHLEQSNIAQESKLEHSHAEAGEVLPPPQETSHQSETKSEEAHEQEEGK